LRGLQNAQQSMAELREKIADLNKELENARNELDYNRQIMRSRWYYLLQQSKQLLLNAIMLVMS